VEDLEDLQEGATDALEPPSPFRLPLRKSTRLEDLDTEFHGDFEFYDSIDGKMYEYVARFTHGKLEWIRPAEECTPMQRQMMERGWW
jgi:hypothetical protein